MAGEGAGGQDDLLARELTCAICTDILYQPLALLDCLHTFCGSCSKEWFAWQAASASQNRRTTSPYTCPSCREAVRGTRADWRLTALLEGYLKVNPDKGKTEKEKEELSKHYTPGEDVLPPVQRAANEDDSEDERLLAEVRELSMAEMDPETGRRRSPRTNRNRNRQDDRSTRDRTARHMRPNQAVSQDAQLTESRLRAHDAGQPLIEHQPSLRSLLSASEADPQDVQADILQSIISEGLLDGIDIDNLTTEQEEELTERIADAYRRRQRDNHRSRNRERRQGEQTSPALSSVAVVAPTQSRPQVDRQQSHPQPSSQPRARPPVSRPHLFEQSLQEPARSDRRSASATGQRNARSTTRNDGSTSASRSATDLSQRPSTTDPQREIRAREVSTGRSATDPTRGYGRDQARHHRTQSGTMRERGESGTMRPQALDFGPDGAVHNHTRFLEVNSTASPPSSPSATTEEAQRMIRPAISTAAFAPELVLSSTSSQSAPSVTCNRCNKSEIQYDLHYNCRWCDEGNFNLCLACYRESRGCHHWFGFGFRAGDRWYRTRPPEGFPNGFDRPHVLTPRRYVRANDQQQQLNTSAPGGQRTQTNDSLEEGAFCESCFSFANDWYWYCTDLCLEGAWGFCDDCVKQGRHCTHPLLPVAYINTVNRPDFDPSQTSFINLPHLRQDSYVPLPVDTSCDICHLPISSSSPRYHCYQCNDGDYDICNDCYWGLTSQGKISQVNGPSGWRRCLKGHRMAVIGYQDTADGGHLRFTLQEPVGGWAFKEDEISLSSQIPAGGLPPDGGVGLRCLALYNYFPKEGVTDELAFPKNAEIREAEGKNSDWMVGVYAGKLNLFPSNHVRIL